LFGPRKIIFKKITVLFFVVLHIIFIFLERLILPKIRQSVALLVHFSLSFFFLFLILIFRIIRHFGIEFIILIILFIIPFDLYLFKFIYS